MIKNIYRCLTAVSCLAAVLIGSSALRAENRPENLEWLKDAGFGLFIHWSVDSQIGTVISHTLVGSSPDYQERFFNELPETFNPTKFDADEWARQAKLSGFKYVVFTAKHHSGFCMFDSETTDFDISATPYKDDILTEVVDAFRAQGLKIGLYFSPDDFHVLWKQGTLISRLRPEAMPENNPGLHDVNKAQVKELLSNYGDIDVMFLDGPKDHNDGGLKGLIWELQPNCLITRGAINTPEISASTTQSLPEEALTEPWEANFTMGTSWQFKPTNETYGSGRQWVQNLIETRAKGGTMLLNIGPEPSGVIPHEQSRVLIEMGAWMMINREAIYDVRPWETINEGDIWYTKAKDEDTVYAFVCGDPWTWGERKSFVLNAVKASDNSEISVLGQNDKVLEYKDSIPTTEWDQTKQGLLISAVRAQRIYNDRKWINPVVIKITNAKLP